MSLRRKLYEGGIALIVGQVMSQGLSAVRNVLIARMILTEYDYGIASTMIMIVTLVETLSYLGTNTLVIQDADGDQLHFLSVVHFVSTMRSLLSGLGLVAISYPFAYLFDVRQAAWAYASLGLVPIFRGLMHHDLYRMQRNYAYGPSILQEVALQILTIVAWFVLNPWFKGYESVAYLLILQAVISTILSHLVAKFPYRWACDLVIVRHVLGFGLPLMYNGFTMFLVYQSERFILSSGSRFFSAAHYDMEDLAAFSAAMLIASIASLFLSRILVALAMPLLSRKDDQFLHRYRLTIQGTSMIAGMATIPLILFSDLIVQLLYEGRYASSASIIPFAACGQALSALRSVSHVGLTSRGLTWDCFYNNLWRSIALPMVLFVAAIGLPIACIAYPALLGEAIALIALASTTSRRLGTARRDLLGPVALLVCGLAAAHFLGFYRDSFQSSFYWTASIGLWLGFSITSLLLFSDLFAEVFRHGRWLNFRNA